MEEIKPKKRINSRKKGNNYECKIANELSVLYGMKIFTNRYTNKRADDMKVDLSTEDLNIQCKNTSTNINYSSVLKDMEDCNYCPEKINVIISKITNKGEFAILRKSDFLDLIEKIHRYEY
jgi:hypothetical protein